MGRYRRDEEMETEEVGGGGDRHEMTDPQGEFKCGRSGTEMGGQM